MFNQFSYRLKNFPQTYRTIITFRNSLTRFFSNFSEIQAHTADGRSTGTLGPLEIYLCNVKHKLFSFDKPPKQGCSAKKLLLVKSKRMGEQLLARQMSKLSKTKRFHNHGSAKLGNGGWIPVSPGALRPLAPRRSSNTAFQNVLCCTPTLIRFKKRPVESYVTRIIPSLWSAPKTFKACQMLLDFCFENTRNIMTK